MTKYIYFMRTKDATRFKIGKATDSLQSRYTGLIAKYEEIFDLESSFYMMLPERADLLGEERAFHLAFCDFLVDPDDAEVFHIEVFNECIDRAAAMRSERPKDDGSWTVHSTADYFKLRRSRVAERLIQKLIAQGHEHLDQHEPQITKEFAGKESKTVWLPRGTRKHFKRLAADKADGIVSAEAHYSRAISAYIKQTKKDSSPSDWSQMLIFDYAKKIRTRESKQAEAVTFKIPVLYKDAMKKLMVDEHDGLKTESAHYTRALCTYLYQTKWMGIAQSKLVEAWRMDVEGRG